MCTLLHGRVCQRARCGPAQHNCIFCMCVFEKVYSMCVWCVKCRKLFLKIIFTVNYGGCVVYSIEITQSMNLEYIVLSLIMCYETPRYGSNFWRRLGLISIVEIKLPRWFNDKKQLFQFFSLSLFRSVGVTPHLFFSCPKYEITESEYKTIAGEFVPTLFLRLFCNHFYFILS